MIVYFVLIAVVAFKLGQSIQQHGLTVRSKRTKMGSLLRQLEASRKLIPFFILIAIVAYHAGPLSRRYSSTDSQTVVKNQLVHLSSQDSHSNQTTILENCNQTCSVTRESLGGQEFQQSPKLVYGGGAKVIFILGYGATGTSATHFLLSTSNNVTTLNSKGILGPNKEGWQVTGVKGSHTEDERWDGALEWVDWEKLAQDYGKFWSVDKPLKIENSPPEIQAPEALKDAFEPRFGKVKFLLLVRGECTVSSHRFPPNRRASGYHSVVAKYPEDTFVLRFEDICLFWDETYANVVRWEPHLVDIDVTRRPDHGQEKLSGKRPKHSHTQTSIFEYCKVVKTKWQSKHNPGYNYTTFEEMKEFGYQKTITCSNP